MNWALIIFYGTYSGAAVTTLHFGTKELAEAARGRLGEKACAYGIVVQVAP